MVTVKIFTHFMPWEIDYALLLYTQLKKSKYYLKDDVKIIIDTHLNLSNYLIDWDKTSIPKEHFITKYNDLAILLKDYEHNSIIYDGDENYGLFDMQRQAYGKNIDFYIPICPDIYFSEHTLTYMIESARMVSNKYFVIVPETYKLWDASWDEITNKKYMDVPYEKWHEGDIYDIRYDLKTSNDDIFLQPTQRSKWAIWFDIYNKAFYEELCPIQEDWKGYGPWDWYSLMLSEYAKSKGVDFQQYVLRGQTSFEYYIGPLLGRGHIQYYKDFIKTKDNTINQRTEFEKNMNIYLNKGIQMLIEKNII